MDGERRGSKRAARETNVFVNGERVGRAILFQSRQRQQRSMWHAAWIFRDQLFSQSRKSLELGAGSRELGLPVFSLLHALCSTLAADEQQACIRFVVLHGGVVRPDL